MARINYVRRDDRWRVTWYAPGAPTRTARSFKTEAEAQSFVANGMPGGERTPRPSALAGRSSRRRTRDEVADLIMASSVEASSGCREWVGGLTNAGYPRLTWVCDEGYAIRGGHRLAYHLFVAPVPNDHLMSIDHLCRNRSCVAPAHLDLVPQRENVMRSPIAPGATNAAKTHCPQGHPYDEANTYVYTFKTKRTTTRICKTCAAAHQRRYQLRRMGVAS